MKNFNQSAFPLELHTFFYPNDYLKPNFFCSLLVYWHIDIIFLVSDFGLQINQFWCLVLFFLITWCMLQSQSFQCMYLPQHLKISLFFLATFWYFLRILNVDEDECYLDFALLKHLLNVHISLQNVKNYSLGMSSYNLTEVQSTLKIKCVASLCLDRQAICNA